MNEIHNKGGRHRMTKISYDWRILGGASIAGDLGRARLTARKNRASSWLGAVLQKSTLRRRITRDGFESLDAGGLRNAREDRQGEGRDLKCLQPKPKGALCVNINFL